jgi:hypothetical protein
MKAKGYGFFSETPIAQANNLKVTIGVAELVSRTIPEAIVTLAENKWSEVQSARGTIPPT